jgi:hypothetical protein
MKQITVDFSKYGDIEKRNMPVTHIANALYEKNLGGNPIYLDEETDIIYAPVCTRDHFERFYGNVKEESDENDINLCDSCTNYGCEFQSGIVRTKCAFYIPLPKGFEEGK